MGTGKSTFLDAVKEVAEREKQKKFVTLDLWRTQNTELLISTAFRKLVPQYYWGIRLFIIFSIIASILTTGVVKIPWNTDMYESLWNGIMISIIPFRWHVLASSIVYNVSYFLRIFGILLTLFVSVSQLLKIRYVEFDMFLFNKKYLKNKVLIIDDFDRLNKQKQEDAYKLFSLLSSKLPIIFVGNYDNIVHNVKNELFLPKIIDRRVELPIVLQPTQIWTSMFDFIFKTFNIQLSYNFKQIFINEKRNLRDRLHFTDYVYQELMLRNKQ